MKRIVIALVCVVASAASAAAPEMIRMKRGVSFDHRAHAASLVRCTTCHATAKGSTIAGFGKVWAHKNCKGCHAGMRKGPTSCTGCHEQ